MMQRTLFRAFEQLADAPGTVAKLRQLILDAGVSGKLVSQDEKDEPARELLAQFPNRAKSGNTRVVENDSLAPLPPGWELVSMGEVADQRLGKMLDKAKNKGTPLPYLRNTNVQWMRFDLDDIKELRFEDREIEDFELRQGDLLICEGGEPGRCAIWENQLERMMFQKALHRLRPHPGVNVRFLALRLRADALAARLDSYFTGATIKHFTGKELHRYSFPLPPTTEQERIVAKVDELLALCDALEARQTTRTEARRRLHAATLHHVTAARSPSHLATHWSRLRTLFDPLHATPDSVPALRRTLLQLAIQGSFTTSKEPPSRFPLGQLLREPSLNGVSKAPSQSPPGTPILRISAGTSRTDGTVDEDDFRYVELDKHIVEKFHLKAGDLLACRFNGNLHYVGKFSLYTGRSNTVQVPPDKLIRFRLDETKCLATFARYALNAQESRAKVESLCATTAGNIGISSTQLKSVEISVPPLAEQKRIVAKVEQLLALCDELETRLKDADTRRERLLIAAIQQIIAG